MMNAEEFLRRPLIEIRCINIKSHNGKRCYSWLGDMASGVHTIQNFHCPQCRLEWLVEKDKTDLVVFHKIPKGTIKNYRRDTGCRMEVHSEQPEPVLA